MIQNILDDESISEIIINDWDQVYIEREGKLAFINSPFTTKNDYLHFCQNISMSLDEDLSLKSPFVGGMWQSFRVQMVGRHITHHEVSINLRRIAEVSWTLERLYELGSLSLAQKNYLEQSIATKKNLLIIGATGSGKTSLLNALLNNCEKNERCLILEDTSEIKIPNPASLKLITHEKSGDLIQSVDLEDLLKVSLRLRPDRIIVGEVRGREAKNLVLALSTGHHGSMGTLHAKNAFEAISRLELLIQMGAPEWHTKSIQKLIYYAFDEVISIQKDVNGKRKVEEIIRISGIEDSGILLEPVLFDFVAKQKKIGG